MKSTTVICALTITLAACTVVDEDISTAQSAIQSSNQLSMNQLSMNQLSMNQLSMNGLSHTESPLTRLAKHPLSLAEITLDASAPGSFALNAAGSAAIETTEDGRELLEYVARCALAHGQELVAAVDGESYGFAGVLGLASDWLVRPLEHSERRLVSACLLTHVNHFGVSVPLSVRGAGLDTSAEERSEYSVYEATFYGDVFGDELEMYACWGTHPRKAKAQSAYRQWRVCSDPQNGSATACSPSPEQPFVFTGFCSDVCAQSDKNAGWSRCATPKGSRYDEALSAWLLNTEVNETL